MNKESLNFTANTPPTGDQSQAIVQLVQGFKEGNQFETILGVTGSGKTFTMANVIQEFYLVGIGFRGYNKSDKIKEMLVCRMGR